MKAELIFKTDSIFKSVTLNEAAGSWVFEFNNNVYATSSGFWRLLQNNEILLVSLDNRHQFDSPKPVDLVDSVNKLLVGKKLMQVTVCQGTQDLKLSISDAISLDIYISSSGYETHEFSIENTRYIGLGSGEIAIVPL